MSELCGKFKIPASKTVGGVAEARTVLTRAVIRQPSSPAKMFVQKLIKGRRPSVSRRVKCQYVVNMSVYNMYVKPEFRGERCRTCPQLTPIPTKRKWLFQVEEINVGISLKAHGYSYLLHTNICKLSQIRKKYMPKNELFPMQKK